MDEPKVPAEEFTLSPGDDEGADVTCSRCGVTLECGVTNVAQAVDVVSQHIFGPENCAAWTDVR